jgi:hypothetical protein
MTTGIPAKEIVYIVIAFIISGGLNALWNNYFMRRWMMGVDAKFTRLFDRTDKHEKRLNFSNGYAKGKADAVAKDP